MGKYNKPPRNFAIVANRVINAIDYYDNTDITRIQRLKKVVILVSSLNEFAEEGVLITKPHIIEKIYRRLEIAEIVDKMDYDTYREFVNRVENIKCSSLYVPPEAHTILWEKLAKLCAMYLDKYWETSWAQKISRIIRDIE